MDTPKKKWPFNKVGKEINEQTIRLAGSNKGIVNVPIKVSVYSPNVIPLTVVDLPGIVKVSFCYLIEPTLCRVCVCVKCEG